MSLMFFYCKNSCNISLIPHNNSINLIKHPEYNMNQPSQTQHNLNQIRSNPQVKHATCKRLQNDQYKSSILEVSFNSKTCISIAMFMLHSQLSKYSVHNNW